jgi:hypothetical protein
VFSASNALVDSLFKSPDSNAAVCVVVMPADCVLVNAAACAVVSAVTCSLVNAPICVELRLDTTPVVNAADALVVSAAKSAVSSELVWLDVNPGVCVLVNTAACDVVNALTCPPCSALTWLELRLVISPVAIAPNAAFVSELNAVVLSLAKSAPSSAAAWLVVTPTVCVLVRAAACDVVNAFT